MAAHERMVVGTAFCLLGRMEDAQDAAQDVSPFDPTAACT